MTDDNEVTETVEDAPMGTNTTDVTVHAAKISELEASNAALQASWDSDKAAWETERTESAAKLNAAKAANYDLMLQVPVIDADAPPAPTNSEDTDAGKPLGIASLFDH